MGIWIYNMTVRPVESNSAVYKAKRVVEHLRDLPRCLRLVVEPEDPLPQVRGTRGNRPLWLRWRAGSRSVRVDMFTSLHT